MERFFYCFSNKIKLSFLNPFENCIFDLNSFDMKYTTIIGTLLIAIGLVASFVAKVDFLELIAQPNFALGLLYGGGLGMLIGGFIGWLYKRTKVEIPNQKVEKK